MPFKHFRQLDAMDCGPTCLRMVAKHHGKNYSINKLRTESGIGKEGVSLLGIGDAAEKIGFRSQGVKISFNQLIEDAPKPAILHWSQHHFVVLTTKAKGNKITIADPAKGLVTYNKKEFLQHWASEADSKEHIGIALLLEPTLNHGVQPLQAYDPPEDERSVQLLRQKGL